MIVWTGEGTLLDTTEPHHTLTIQKKIHIRHYEITLTYTIGHIGHKDEGHWRKHPVAPP